MNQDDFQVECDATSGAICSVRLYGHELLDAERPCGDELRVNGIGLPMTPYPVVVGAGQAVSSSDMRLRGTRGTEHFSGWGLVVARRMGHRMYAKHPGFGINYTIRREIMDRDAFIAPGPGGPPVEAPLFVDSFGLLNLNWQFWGEDTRMIFPSAHSSGPDDEWGHVGYEHDSPEACKRYLQNTWRRIYPGVMVIHGGVFYNATTGQWLAITCRRPQLGYTLNIDDAGRGVAYDFNLHAMFNLGDNLTIPEIQIHWGADSESMWRWMADYVFHYYRRTPEWVGRTLWMGGVNWDNQPSWEEQASWWEEQLEQRSCNGISYSLITARPLKSGTAPFGYHPDPAHGTEEEFKTMCRRLADQGVPLLYWMSHSGLMYRGSDAIDDDWFIRGIDGRVSASWGSEDSLALCHINPGHPGYIAYTKRWLHFYIKECGMKGVFMDCLGWAFPPDYAPRDFMRYPGDTNRMAIRFLDEIAAYIKELDPEAIIFGEGTTFDAPVDLATINFNPQRGIDGRGPRDFLLALNAYHPTKRMVLDQGPLYSIASGMARALPPDHDAGRNAALRALLQEHGAEAFTAHTGDIGILASERLVVVPQISNHGQLAVQADVRLPSTWQQVQRLVSTIDGSEVVASDGCFPAVPAGIYRMEDA